MYTYCADPVLAYGVSFMFLLFHKHDFTLWEKGFKHSWKHYIESERHCKKCNYREYQLLDIFCPTYKKTGEWCNACRPYGDIWEKHFDNLEIKCDNIGMKKRGRPALLERNIQIYRENQQGMAYPAIMAKYGFKAKSTVSEIINRIAEQEKNGLITG